MESKEIFALKEQFIQKNKTKQNIDYLLQT